MKQKAKPIESWTDVELIMEKNKLISEIEKSLWNGYYNTAHAFTGVLILIKEEMIRRGIWNG